MKAHTLEKNFILTFTAPLINQHTGGGFGAIPALPMPFGSKSRVPPSTSLEHLFDMHESPISSIPHIFHKVKI